jgi:hypothetical protein
MQMCITYKHPDEAGGIAQRAANTERDCARRADEMQKTMNDLAVKGKLVSAETLLDQLFDPQCRPSLRWLRTQTKAKAIPHVRIGHLVFFDLEMVRATLSAKNLVRHRLAATSSR